MAVNPKTLNEILDGVANMRKLVDWVHDLQKRTNQQWLDYSSPHCRMHVEDYMNNAFAYYWQGIMDNFGASGDEEKALRQATSKLAEVAQDYHHYLYAQVEAWLRYSFTSRRQAEERFEHLLSYTAQFAHVEYGRQLIPKWLDGKPLSPPEWPRSMKPE